jgi:hypothetical protein
MNYAELERQQNELAMWLAQTDWQVFGTLKWTDGHSIGEQRAEAILRKYFNSLDKTYFGDKMVAAGHRIERAVFRHMGTSNSNLHYHFVARPNTNIAAFCETARCAWEEASSFTMGYENTWIGGVRDVENAVHYGLHEYKTLGADTLFLPATHCAQPRPTPKPIHQLRRLLVRKAANERTKETALRRAAIAARRIR